MFRLKMFWFDSFQQGENFQIYNQKSLFFNMQALKQKLATNVAPKHYLAYCLSFMAYGCVITGLGPLIPYLSEETHYQQTEYSFMFFCRSMGFLFGAIVLRFLEKKMTFHNILLFSSVLLLILLTMFSLIYDMTKQGIIMFFVSAACCTLEVTINVSVLEVQKNNELQFWMLICHGVFGIGGLVGPIFVYFFELYSFIVMGVLIVLISPFYWILKTPENHKEVEERVSRQGLIQEIKNVGHEGTYPAIQKKPERKVIGRQIELLVSFMFLIYIGLECSYGSWIASYAVLQEIASKQSATMYSSIFWISITFFRFASVCLPYKSMKKLFLLAYGFVILSLATIFLLFIGMKGLACMFSAVMFGMCYSSMFPLLLAIPSDYNMEISASQGANFMMWCAMGEAILATLVGYSMAWFTNDMLFYIMFMMGAVFLVSNHGLKYMYEKQSNNFGETSKTSIELTQVLTSTNKNTVKQ